MKASVLMAGSERGEDVRVKKSSLISDHAGHSGCYAIDTAKMAKEWYQLQGGSYQ